MATSIIGLGGLNTSGGTDKLIAGFSTDLVDVDAGTGFGLNLTSTNNVEFASFLDSLFFQNFNHTPLTYDGTSWTNLHVKKTPVAKFIKQFGERMFLGHIKINSTTYASRVWFSDLPTTDDAGNLTIQWGFQEGTNGSITANTNRFRAADAGFKTYGIKVGDPLTIESGANAGEYTVARISDDQMIEIVETFTTTQSSITYWVGSNWFDVRTNNSDTVQGLSEVSGQFLIYKLDTLHRFNGATLSTVRGPGTSSGRSIVYLPERDINIYFHGSNKERTGFYLTDARESINISRAIQPFIDGISASNFPLVVGWREGDVYRAFVGNVSNINSANDSYNISFTNVVLSYSVPDNRWSIDPISDVIKATATLRESNERNIFIGNDSSEVFKTPSGFSFDGDPIPFAYETRVIYPRGNEIINFFTRIKVVARDAGRVKVMYKLWDGPFDVDQTWHGLDNLNKDTVEMTIPQNHNRGAGIQFRFEEFGTKEPVPVIEKISIYSTADTKDTPEIKELS